MQGSFPAQDGGSERLVEYRPGETDFDDKRRAGTFFQSSNDYFAIYGDKYTLQVRGSYFTSKRVFTQHFERQSMFDLDLMKMCNPKDQVEETVEGSARWGRGATYMFIRRMDPMRFELPL